MVTKTVTFYEVKDIARCGYDEKAYRFRYSVIDSSTPEEHGETKHYTLDVIIEASRMGDESPWNLEDDDLVKVLFEIGKKETEILKKIEADKPFKEKEKFTVTDRNYGPKLPYNPSNIDDPIGATYKVGVKRKIGF